MNAEKCIAWLMERRFEQMDGERKSLQAAPDTPENRAALERWRMDRDRGVEAMETTEA